MNQKEMIPAPAPGMRMIDTYCKPEWDMLCRIRYGIKQIIKEKRARDMRKLLIGLIGHMDDVFDDWPEDPK